MRVHFLGAAQTVTGSMHLVETPRARVLLDCGLFQGRRRESYERNRTLPFRARDVDVCVISHAHIDHSGASPMLGKSGFDGRIFCTPATRDLCAAMLEDSAMIQRQDAGFLQRQRDKGDLDDDVLEPLYGPEDVVDTLSRMHTLPYRHRSTIAPGVDLTFLDAGHVLGSAIVILDVDHDGENRRLVFSGDLGRRHMPILRDPEIPTGAHALILESTYGDRLHDPIETMEDRLSEIIDRTVARGGKLLIPSFALERAQEVVFALRRLHDAGRLPKGLPIYVDSPLTVRVTEIFKLHPDCYDEDTRAMLASGDSPFDLPGLTYVSSVEDSKRVTATKGPAIVISASGMVENGRVLHHLKSIVEDRASTVLIVGFQAPHTLGRRLVEGRSRVRIFGVERDRLCEVAILNGLSAHADRDDLIAFAEAARDHGRLRHVALVHGDPPAQRSLADALGERGFPDVRVPAPGDVMEV
ncbi:MAG: MBL fold metallo-hydrolase [Myxococcota bacterium]|jgi:metallo-beta-lactamase family protein|nr:MBL fold metallo-hydrolase [Myxococcota bacterium]